MYADLGRMVSNPELKQTTGGKSVCSFTIAVDDVPAADGTKRANFIDCVAWGKRAEHIVKYFPKGTRIFVAGDIKTRTYTDAEGRKHKFTEVLVDNVKFCESRQKDTAQSAKAGGQYETPYDAPEYAVDTASFEQVSPDEDLPF